MLAIELISDSNNEFEPQTIRDAWDYPDDIKKKKRISLYEQATCLEVQISQCFAFK